MKKETRELIQVQAGLQCLVEQALKTAYQKPAKPSMTLRDIYISQFININEQQLKGIYNDRSRNFRSKQRVKTAC